ncbi:hypothetical protein VF21_06054 [Pseudogymnoascus sp. 05NY08]|nr:hypothetical protein VF21_06054 [Pseudogymnoascus sp. 05NY08]
MTTASFWIEIIPKPIYVGGTGPPMAPITLLPEHDEESWVIAEVIEYKMVPHYVVHPKDKPVVRRIIAKNEALDWVSPLVYEEFEMAEGLRRDAREEELRLEKERSKLTKKRKKRGRPFRNARTEASALVESIETETDNPDDAQPSNAQPSLSKPNLRMDSRFDTEATEDEAISRTMEPPPSKRSRTSTSEGRLSSKTPRYPPEHLSSPQTVQKRKNPAPTSKPHRQSKSTADEPSTPRHTPSPSKQRTSETRSLRDRSAQPFYGHQRQGSQTVYPPQSASPAKSRRSTSAARQPTRSSSRSRNATPSAGGGIQKGWKSAPPKPTSSTPQNRSKSTTTSTPSRPKAPPANVNDNAITDDKQWKVLRLLDDKWEMKTQRRCHYYLTQWAGDYEPTWERSTNITSDLKVEYENWMKTPEGRAHRERKEAVERGLVEQDVPAERSGGERLRSSGSSSADDQAQASKQLGAHIADLSVPDENRSTTDTPDPLAVDPTDSTTTVKREQSDESMDELVLVRSPFFPSPSQVGAEAAESDEEE